MDTLFKIFYQLLKRADTEFIRYLYPKNQMAQPADCHYRSKRYGQNHHPEAVAELMKIVEAARRDLGDDLTGNEGTGRRKVGSL